MDRNFGNRGRSGPRDDFGSAPPVNVGEEFDVKIEAVGEKGDGVAKINGFVIFVPGVKEGQTVKVKVTRVLRKVGFGEVVGNATSTPATSTKSKEPEEAEETYSAENDSDDFGEESTESTDDAEVADEEEDK
jgi:predicted RNA-binding protein with TRAM domain